MRSLSCVATVMLLCGAAAADWPQFMGPGRNGVSKETGWLTQWPAGGPKVLWRRNVGHGHSAVSVVGSRAYTMGFDHDQDNVLCLDVETGKPLWTYAYPCEAGSYPGPHSTPTVDGDRVYTLSREGLVLCLTAEKGQLVWKCDVKKTYKAKGPHWSYAGSPLVVGEKLIVEVGGAGAGVVAFNKADGKELWTSPGDTPAHSSPLSVKLGGKTCVLVFSGTALVCLDAADGKRLWRYPWKARVPNTAATPILIDGDKVFVSSSYDGGCALLKMEADKVTELWKNRYMENLFANCMVVGGHLYGLHGRHGGASPMRCMEIATGKVVWSKPTVGGETQMLAGGNLILLSGEGVLKIAKPSPMGLEVLASAKVLPKNCWTAPVLANGRIYCRNNTGDLVCLDVRRRPGP